jgi:hypothetical protein
LVCFLTLQENPNFIIAGFLTGSLATTALTTSRAPLQLQSSSNLSPKQIQPVLHHFPSLLKDWNLQSASTAITVLCQTYNQAHLTTINSNFLSPIPIHHGNPNSSLPQFTTFTEASLPLFITSPSQPRSYNPIPPPWESSIPNPQPHQSPIQHITVTSTMPITTQTRELLCSLPEPPWQSPPSPSHHFFQF